MDLITLDNVSLTFKQRKSLFKSVTFDAVSQLSFSIHEGETLGVVGGNGSGKSTLLKVISAILEPDSGSIVRNTRRISHLSLQVGFDLELSGRENIIIGSLLLGASYEEIKSKMNSIIDFSGLDNFIDLPVKTYSAGMRARLGFSMALEMQTDLLLIDEVLGVGDSNFKMRAEKALREVISSNQSVVLVSHSLAQIARLCDRVVWIERGRLMKVGETKEVLLEYESYIKQQKDAKIR